MRILVFLWIWSERECWSSKTATSFDHQEGFLGAIRRGRRVVAIAFAGHFLACTTR
jgi:hypothetical protein